MSSILITMMFVLAGCLPSADEGLLSEDSYSAAGVLDTQSDTGTDDSTITKSAVAPLLSNITIISDTDTVAAGDKVNLTLTANYSDGSMKYVTSKGTWSVKNGVGSFSSPGVYVSPSTALDKTSAIVAVKYAEGKVVLQTSTTLTISNPVHEPPVIDQGDAATLTVDPKNPTSGANQLTLTATASDNATMAWTIAPDSTLVNGKAQIMGTTTGNTVTVGYTPNDSYFTGLDSFAVIVTDSKGATDRVDVKVEVVQDTISARDFGGGFNAIDATCCLQTAINSGAKRIVVTNEGTPWIVAPIYLASNQEIYFEDGVIVQAKENDADGKPFRTGCCLFNGYNDQNITLIGYNATLRMNKSEYTGQWRHVIRLEGCTNVTIKGLKLEDSGGDGLYIGVSNTIPYCKDIYITDVTCNNNRRNGISIISAENMTIDNCILTNSSGEGPQAGLDIEPNPGTSYVARLTNINVKNTTIYNNALMGVTMNITPFTQEYPDVSINFENVTIKDNKMGLIISNINDNGPAGLVEFKNVILTDNGFGIRITDKSNSRADVRFISCRVENSGSELPYPISIGSSSTDTRVITTGGIEFIDCGVIDNQARAAVGSIYGIMWGKKGVSDISGNMDIVNPLNGAYTNWNGATAENITLSLNKVDSLN